MVGTSMVVSIPPSSYRLTFLSSALTDQCHQISYISCSERLRCPNLQGIRIAKSEKFHFLIRLSTKNYASLRYVFVDDDLE